MHLERVVVVGSSGSGKTTFARRLTRALGTKHLELDALYWRPGWDPTPEAEFLAKLEPLLAEPAWVVDGNYSLAVRSLVWSRATALVWLNYPLPLTLARVLGRTFRRALTREEIFSGNRESLSQAFMSRRSILLWALESHPRYREEYPAALRELPHLAVYEFGRPSQAEAFLLGVEQDM